jgi:hypothetical protein
MPQQRKPNDLSRSLIALDMDTTLIAVVELSLSSWLVAGIVPGIERQALMKLKTDENALLALFNHWRDEAVRSGHKISRIAVAFEAGRQFGLDDTLLFSAGAIGVVSRERTSAPNAVGETAWLFAGARFWSITTSGSSRDRQQRSAVSRRSPADRL